MSSAFRNIWLMALCGLFFCLSACSPRALHEAQRLVAHADSLRAEGQMCSDSAQLAQAYTTLETWQWLYADDYAHACYHYGRLLRAKEDPVSAMQVFINATHSRTRDYHILGRVYNNMGDICHLAEEYALAFNMYSKSTDCFETTADSLAYCYGLYRMAYEKADMADSVNCMKLLGEVEKSPMKQTIEPLLTLARAELYLKIKQYDSAIYYATKVCSIDTNSVSALLIKAQAFSYKKEQDSATHYANITLTNTNELYNINNALYILTNDDQTKDRDAVRKTAAERSDTQKLVEIRKSRLSQAVQLLEQDLTRGLNWVKWSAVLLAFLCIISGLIYLGMGKRRKAHMQKTVKMIADKQANDIITSINTHINANDLNGTLHWKDYAAMKIEANLYMGNIVSKLESYGLNEAEIRFCVLTLLDFRLNKIAEIIHYSFPSGIKTLKKRIADKLGTTPIQLKNFLLHLLPKT